MLRFTIEVGDKVLQKHLATTSSRATSTLSEITNCCSLEINNAILTRILQFGIDSIIFRETSVLLNKAQVNLIPRYVNFGDMTDIWEDFIAFTGVLQ